MQFDNITFLKIEDIEIPQGLLPRVLTGTVEKKVEEYKELLEEGIEFEPILVWKREDGRYWVIDGVHRIKAHKRIGRKEIKVKFVECKNELDYRIKAIQANLKHGLALAKGERPILAQILYKEGLSEEEIRKIFGVSDRTVREWLKPVKEEEKREKIKKALELREKGYTHEQIAKELGVDRSTITKWLAKSEESSKFAKISLLTHSGDPTPEGLRLWSEYVEQADTEKEDLFDPKKFSQFLKNKGLEVQKVEKIGDAYLNGTPEQFFMIVVKQRIKQYIENAVNNGLSETEIRTLLSKAKRGIFEHISSTAKAKLAGMFRDYIQNLIKEREEREKEEKLVLETAKEIVSDREFIFSNWKNLGKLVLERIEEKGNSLKHKYHETDIAKILQKHSDEIMTIYEKTPVLSIEEIQKAIDNLNPKEFTSHEEAIQKLKEDFKNYRIPYSLDLMVIRKFDQYYKKKKEEQEKHENFKKMEEKLKAILEDATFEWNDQALIDRLLEEGFPYSHVIEFLTKNREKLISYYSSIPEPDEDKIRETFEALESCETEEELVEEAKVRLIEEGYRFTSKVENSLRVLWKEKQKKNLSVYEVLSEYFKETLFDNFLNPENFIEFANKVGYPLEGKEDNVRKFFRNLEKKINELITSSKDRKDFIKNFEEFLENSPLKGIDEDGKLALKERAKEMFREIREKKDEVDEILEEILEKVELLKKKIGKPKKSYLKELAKRVAKEVVEKLTEGDDELSKAIREELEKLLKDLGDYTEEYLKLNDREKKWLRHLIAWYYAFWDKKPPEVYRLTKANSAIAKTLKDLMIIYTRNLGKTIEDLKNDYKHFFETWRKGGDRGILQFRYVLPSLVSEEPQSYISSKFRHPDEWYEPVNADDLLREEGIEIKQEDFEMEEDPYAPIDADELLKEEEEGGQGNA